MTTLHFGNFTDALRFAHARAGRRWINLTARGNRFIFRLRDQIIGEWDRATFKFTF